MTVRRSPLDARHRALGAKMVPFAGWDMPLNYPDGTIVEHMTCRDSAVVFDVSHMGSLRLTGSRAFDLLQAVFTNDLGRITPGRAQYSHLLDTSDASVVDDVIIAWVTPDTFEVVANASNASRVLSVLEHEADGLSGIEILDVTERRAMVAVQGPAARKLVTLLNPDIAAIQRFGVARFEWQGMPGLVTGTGYTGEDGFECSVPIDVAESFWDAVVSAGVVPAGLGARDTLRLEAGFPLHGHELGHGITPLQAGLGWVVSWDKGEFLGRAALLAEREAGPSRLLTGIVTEGRRPPRAGYDVVSGDVVVGTVTSGNFSPVLEQGVALAFVSPIVNIGDTVDIDIRGTRVAGRVVKPPFVKGS